MILAVLAFIELELTSTVRATFLLLLSLYMYPDFIGSKFISADEVPE